MQILVSSFYFLIRYRTPWVLVSPPIKFCIVNQNLQLPTTPQPSKNATKRIIQMNAPYNSQFGQLATDKKKHLANLYPFYNPWLTHSKSVDLDLFQPRKQPSLFNPDGKKKQGKVMRSSLKTGPLQVLELSLPVWLQWWRRRRRGVWPGWGRSMEKTSLR